MTTTDETIPQPTSQPLRYFEVIAARLNAHTTLAVADLADEIAADEHGRPLSAVDPTEVCDVYLTLCETLLPALAQASFVVYDTDRDLVSLPNHGSDSLVELTERTDSRGDESDNP